MSSIIISVVIATCNRQTVLVDCLKSLEKQSLDRDLFEVVVVNDGSTDSTEHFLRDFQLGTKINFRFITHENQGVSYSRNAGIRAALGEYIAFTDDDCIVPEGWLRQMYDRFASPEGEVAGVGGPLVCFTSHPDTYISRFISYVDDFNYIPVLGKMIIMHSHVSKLRGGEVIPYLRTSNSMFRKSCLEEIGGFDIDFRRPGGEDPDLCYRLLNLNYRLCIDKDLVVSHHSRDSFSSYFKSLKNYLAGEFRKSKKRSLYANVVIRRSYEYLILRKIAVAVIFCLLCPFSIINGLRRKKYPLTDSLTFPFIIIASKFYALAVTTSFYLGISDISG